MNYIAAIAPDVESAPPIEALELMWTSVLPIVKTLVMCSIGAVLARHGLLKPEGRQVLNQLGFYVFIPALAFTKLAQSVSWHNLGLWWPLPLNVLLSVGLGLGIGKLAASIPQLRTPEALKVHVILCSGLGNATNLPMMVIATLCDDPSSIAARNLGGVCQQTGLAYVAFGSWVMSILQYTLASNMLRLPALVGAHDQPYVQMEEDDNVYHLDTEADAESPPALKTREGLPYSAQTDTSIQMTPLERAPSTGKPSAKEVPPLLVGGSPESSREEDDLQGEDRGPAGRKVSFSVAAWKGRLDSMMPEARRLALRQQMMELSTKIKRKRIRGLGMDISLGESLAELESVLDDAGRPFRDLTWKQIFPLPTAAALAGLFVGAIRPLQKLFYGSGGPQIEAPPLFFLIDSLSILAGAAIPGMMLVLGALLAYGPQRGVLPTHTILASIAVKQILVPAIGTVVVLALIMIELIKPPSQLFVFVLLLQHAVPTAINMQTVAALHGSGEAEVSTLLFWQYAASTVLLTIWMTVFQKIAEMYVPE